MPCGKKRKKRKMNTHKRKKRLRANRHKIKVGNKLKIPMKGAALRTWGTKDNGGPAGHYKVTYKVKRGDTLGQIAEDYKTSASKIRRWNRLKYGSSLIYPGQKLKIWVKEG